MPFGDGRDSRNHLHGACLAGAVRTWKAETLPFYDIEIYAVCGHELLNSLGQLSRGYYRGMLCFFSGCQVFTYPALSRVLEKCGQSGSLASLPMRCEL